jgi:hypothetical protein
LANVQKREKMTQAILKQSGAAGENLSSVFEMGEEGYHLETSHLGLVAVGPDERRYPVDSYVDEKDERIFRILVGGKFNPRDHQAG